MRRIPKLRCQPSLRTFSHASSVQARPIRNNRFRGPTKPHISRSSRPDSANKQPADVKQAVSQSPQESKNAQLVNALQASASGESADLGLVAPVHIPEDKHGVLRNDHESTSILANSSIVIARQLEMMNVFLGFEQANRYIIHDAQGNHIGYLAEQEHGIGNAVARQMLRTHRSFTAHVFDRHEREVLRFHRPFSWINSRIRVYDALHESTQHRDSTSLQGTSASSVISQSNAQISSLLHTDMRVIGEARQQWAPLRRKYNLFLHRDISLDPANPRAPALQAGDLPLSTSTDLTVAESGSENMGMAQFAYVDEPFLSWDFSLKSEDSNLVGSVNRNFSGFAREIFTDTGVYALRMDAAGLAGEPDHYISQTHRGPPNTLGMTLDQRAVMLATAVSIDFDYFSRHSHAGAGGFMPLWFPMGGGGSAEAGGAAGGAAGEAGGAGGAVTEQAGRGVATGASVPESAAVGGATLAGYDMMQQRRELAERRDDTGGAADAGIGPNQSGSATDEWTWGNDDDPWNGKGGGGSAGGDGGGGGGGGGGGDGDGFDIGDLF